MLCCWCTSARSQHPSKLLCCISGSVHAQKSQIDLSRCHCRCSPCLLLSGGYISNSLAIMTDAVHMLTDVVGILFSLLALWLSTKPPTRRFTFGLHRLGKPLSSDACTLPLFTSPLSPLLYEWDKWILVVLMQMNHVQRRKGVFSCVQARSDFKLWYF